MRRHLLEIALLLAVVGLLAHWMVGHAAPGPIANETPAPPLDLVEEMASVGVPDLIIVLLYTAVNTVPFALVSGWICYWMTAGRKIKMAHIVVFGLVGGFMCVAFRFYHMSYSSAIQPDGALFGSYLGIVMGLGYRQDHERDGKEVVRAKPEV